MIWKNRLWKAASSGCLLHPHSSLLRPSGAAVGRLHAEEGGVEGISSLFLSFSLSLERVMARGRRRQKMSSAQWLIPEPAWFMAPPRLFCRSLWCHITQAAQTTAPDIAVGERARKREEGQWQWGGSDRPGWTRLQGWTFFITLWFSSWHKLSESVRF